MLKPSDLRIHGFRDKSVHWRGVYTITHTPSGKSVTFRCQWDDRSEPRERALAELDKMVSHRNVPAPPAMLLCHCGEIAVIGYYPGDGRRPNRFFCEAHQSEAQEMADRNTRARR